MTEIGCGHRLAQRSLGVRRRCRPLISRRKTRCKWNRASLIVEPRSIYLLRGPSRTSVEHSIPAVNTLRFSLTFRIVLEPTHCRPLRQTQKVPAAEGKRYAGVPHVAASACMLSRVMPPVAMRSMALTIRAGSRWWIMWPAPFSTSSRLPGMAP